jgi:xanthine dehydrogenase accessory factor
MLLFVQDPLQLPDKQAREAVIQAHQFQIVVRGSGDVGSAVAHRLFLSGYNMILHDGPQPATTRRGMAFTDAIFDGQAVLEGLYALRVDDLHALPGLMAEHRVLPIVVAAFDALIGAVQPGILIDARMRKRTQPDRQRGLARLTIGLGPNFVAGETTDLAIETSWGDDLGAIVEQGPTRPLGGDPRPLAGHSRDRFVYAPCTGIFQTGHHIGDPVSRDEIVAHIGDTALHAPLTGILRGLTRDGVPVSGGTKVIEVDPRGSAPVVTGIGERPRRIAEGVMHAVEAWMKRVNKLT